VRGVSVSDRFANGCGGAGGEEEERLLQQRHNKDTNRHACGLGV
jgi:hypothetical protein